ncbi:MAG TPA: PP2C family protein-serine/threonine phosphatase [Actinomycetes bacterium]
MASGGTPSLPVRLARGGRRAWTRLRRGFLRTDTFTLLVLMVLVVFMGVLTAHIPTWVPPVSPVVAILIGGFTLSVRSLIVLLVVVAVEVSVLIGHLGLANVQQGNIAVIAGTAIVVLAVARSRARLGVQGLRGESMLVDLRDRLRAHGELPELPVGWSADVVLRPAGGASFSGDFLVASKGSDDILEIVLVDVSGKGVDAGTRALLLSGAFGGLLGALPSEEFLNASNDYLLRQGWDEGFATAVHVAINLRTGSYLLGSAGHPPAAQFVAGAGTWRLLEAAGTALGIDATATYDNYHGTLGHGDALLLYTDGLVERPGQDITIGIDKLLGEAERLVPRGFRRGARRLIDALRTGESDDRALVMLWRG